MDAWHVKSTEHIQRMLTQGVVGKRSHGLEARTGGKRKQRRGLGTQKPQTLRGLVASCSHLCLKHGHRAVGDTGKCGSPHPLRGSHRGAASALLRRRVQEKGEKEAFLSHVPKECILCRAKGKIRTIQVLRHCLCCFKFSWQHLTSSLTQRGI